MKSEPLPHVPNIHVLIFILICVCCCSWFLICPCITLIRSSPSEASGSLTDIAVTVQEPLCSLSSSSRAQVQRDVAILWQYCVIYQSQPCSCLSALHWWYVIYDSSLALSCAETCSGLSLSFCLCLFNFYPQLYVCDEGDTGCVPCLCQHLPV